MVRSLLSDVGYSDVMSSWLAFVFKFTARIRLTSTGWRRRGLLLDVPVALTCN